MSEIHYYASEATEIAGLKEELRLSRLENEQLKDRLLSMQDDIEAVLYMVIHIDRHSVDSIFYCALEFGLLRDENLRRLNEDLKEKHCEG